MVPTQEPHNSVCPKSCPDLSRVEPPGVEREGLVDLLFREVPLVRFTGKWKEWPEPESHII